MHGYELRGMINMLRVFPAVVLDKPAAARSGYIAAGSCASRETGWLPLAFAGLGIRPPRQNGAVPRFLHNHASQWRYEKLTAQSCCRVTGESG